MGKHTAKQPRVPDSEIFSVSATMNFFSWLICEHPGVWRRVSNFATSVLHDELADINIRKPVWVTGLARSGSTLLLEILARTPGVVSHTYKDFPAVFTPYLWNRLLGYMTTAEAKPAERAHRDGIKVTHDSPEAMEEPLWMAFFEDAHDPKSSDVVKPGSNPEFAAFFRDHIRKLLAVREGRRYLAKANYNLTRMEYLLDVFPDARFVVPVRDPVMHIASLRKQHRLFTRGQRANQRARQHLRRVGHFEFGLDRRPINPGDRTRVREIQALWREGDDVRGWARYWAMLYDYALDRMAANPGLDRAARITRFENLCAAPQAELESVFRHCELRPTEEYLRKSAARIRPPRYYEPDFTPAELAAIREETRDTVARLDQISPLVN